MKPVEHAQVRSQPAMSAYEEAQPVEPEEIARRAVETAFERTRIHDWAEAVRSADSPVAILIARPDPDGRRPSYPSATEAYRDIAEVIGKL